MSAVVIRRRKEKGSEASLRQREEGKEIVTSSSNCDLPGPGRIKPRRGGGREPERIVRCPPPLVNYRPLYTYGGAFRPNAADEAASPKSP